MKKIDVTFSGHKVSRKHAIAYITINGHNVRHNAKAAREDRKPVIRVAKSQSGPAEIYVDEIGIDGPSKLLYSPDEPIMKCGARLVLIAAFSDLRILRL